MVTVKTSSTQTHIWVAGMGDMLRSGDLGQRRHKAQCKIAPIGGRGVTLTRDNRSTAFNVAPHGKVGRIPAWVQRPKIGLHEDDKTYNRGDANAG